MTITGALSGGTIWGAGTYRIDSNIAMAAVHAGFVSNGETKEVYIIMERAQTYYFGSTRNGITSTSFQQTSDMPYDSYYFMASPKLWVQIGNDIYGAQNEFLGEPSLSSDGTIITVFGTGILKTFSLPVTGKITYTSSDTSVAGIYGDIVVLYSAGTATIRVSQGPSQLYMYVLTVSLATSAFSSATFTVPSTKTNVDAPFSITTAPSSASAGAITYASSNTAVATIHATTGQITVVGAGGPMYFIATQAATATYASATVNSSTLTVSIATSLAGQTLTGNLAGKDFTGTSFAGATIQSGVSLAGATLSGANFTGATLAGVDFSGATITGTNFANASIVGATNLPAFSTTQKLQLLRNSYNSAIGAVQISTALTGADINAAITTPVSAIAGATFVVKAPSYNGGGEKVITVISADVSGNASMYIPLNDNETVKINGVAYTFDGANVQDATGRTIRFLTILDTPYRLYAGSIIGLNVEETLNSIKFAGTGLYDIFAELFAFKN